MRGSAIASIRIESMAAGAAQTQAYTVDMVAVMKGVAGTNVVDMRDVAGMSVADSSVVDTSVVDMIVVDTSVVGMSVDSDLVDAGGEGRMVTVDAVFTARGAGSRIEAHMPTGNDSILPSLSRLRHTRFSNPLSAILHLHLLRSRYRNLWTHQMDIMPHHHPSRSLCPLHMDLMPSRSQRNHHNLSSSNPSHLCRSLSPCYRSR